MTALGFIRNYRVCIKASGIKLSDIPYISKINWTSKDHEGEHRERENKNNIHGHVGVGHRVVRYRSAHN